MANHAPQALIVGPLSLDRFDERTTPGGAVSYAARTASALGRRLAVLTGGGPDADRSALAGHDVHFVDAGPTLTFEFDEGPDDADTDRRMRLRSRPVRPLCAADLPPGWERAPLLLLAPLLPDDIDITSFTTIEAPAGRALLAQGLQRVVGDSGAVSYRTTPSPALFQPQMRRYSLFLSVTETAEWPRDGLNALVRHVARLVVTRGPEGADIYTGAGAPLHVEAAPARPLDTTGAGDVFATAFMLAVATGAGDRQAAALASACAAAAVERRGPAPLPPRAEIERRIPAAGVGTP